VSPELASAIRFDFELNKAEGLIVATLEPAMYKLKRIVNPPPEINGLMYQDRTPVALFRIIVQAP
jgi:hypothetical protein